MSQKVDLDEREHALSILQRLKKMKQDRQHCNFVVNAEGKEFHAHRDILSAGSDYFNVMLTKDTKESQQGKVEMMDADSECVEVCINYIYSGQAEIPEGKVMNLLYVSTTMQLLELTKAISLLLEENSDTSNFYYTKRMAEMFFLDGLLEACKTFGKVNVFPLLIQDDFQSEKADDIGEILTSALLSEQEKLIVSLRWAGGATERISVLLDFLKSIRLEEVSEDYLINILESNILIKHHYELFHIFEKARIQKIEVNNGEKSLIFLDVDSDSLRQLNPTTNTVEKCHDETFEKFRELSVIALGSYIFILCADQSVHRLRFQDKKAKWQKMVNMLEFHGNHPPSVSLNGLLYVVGGDREGNCSLAEKFYPGFNRWVRVKDKPIATFDDSLVSLAGSIYVIGGQTKHRHTDAFYRYCSQSTEWDELEPMRNTRHSCGAVAVNQKIYVFGGMVGENITSEMECYDVASGQWTTLSPMIYRHASISAHYICGRIFAIEPSERSVNIEEYHIEGNEWHGVRFNGADEFEIYDAVLV